MLLAVRPAVIGLLLCTAYDLGGRILRAKGMGWDAALAGGGSHSFTVNQEVANGCFGTVEAHVGSSDDA